MPVKQLLVSFYRSIADEPAAARITLNLLAIEQYEPSIDPLAERHLVRRDVLADVTGADQSAKLFAGIGQTAVDCFGESLAVQSIAQPVDVFAAGVDCSVAV